MRITTPRSGESKLKTQQALSTESGYIYPSEKNCRASMRSSQSSYIFSKRNPLRFHLILSLQDYLDGEEEEVPVNGFFKTGGSTWEA